MKRLFQAIFLSSIVAFAACSDDDDDAKKDSTPSNNTTPTDTVPADPALADPYAGYPETRTFSVGDAKFKMIKVEGGKFLMGAQSTDPTAPNYDADAQATEGPVHSVTLSTYYMAEYETTCNIVRAVGISSGSGSETDMPIRNIVRPDLIKFVNALNSKLHAAGQLEDDENFVFPTEAQWEYAARGGKYSKGYIYAGSNDYTKVAYVKENSNGYSFTYVGSFAPNELGLYDMSGNVCEMCSDYWGNYSADAQVDPTQPAEVADNTKWAMRGGTFYVSKTAARVSARSSVNSTTNVNSFSLRLALVKNQK